MKLLKLTILFTFPNEIGQPPVDFVEIRVESHVNRSLNYTKEIVYGLDKNAVNKYLKEYYGRSISPFYREMSGIAQLVRALES